MFQDSQLVSCETEMWMQSFGLGNPGSLPHTAATHMGIFIEEMMLLGTQTNPHADTWGDWWNKGTDGQHWTESRILKRYLHHVIEAFFLNNQEVKAIGMSTDGWIGK